MQAIDQYDKGLDVQCSDAGVNSILCANRAHVNLLLGNFRNAYHDGLAALRHNDQNIKVRCVALRCAAVRYAALCSAGMHSSSSGLCAVPHAPA